MEKDNTLKIDKANLIWIDLEMTGLDTEKDEILEIATIVTDKDLKVLKYGPSIVIHQSTTKLEAMDEWNQEHHGDSGLIQDSIHSTVTAQEAEQTTIKFLKEYCHPNQSPMSGNSICQDRRFLAKRMPELEQFFHYRNLDVTSVRMLIQRWQPSFINKKSKKQSAHRAQDDIVDSINELQHYRLKLFNLD